MERYDVEYRDVEGDNYEQSFDTEREAWEFIRRLQKEDCTVVQTWVYIDDEYKGGFY
jgi:hypothetical protein